MAATRNACKIHYIDPRRILPLHELRRFAHLKELIARMRKHGWEGRPLVVERLSGRPGHYQAWSGNHRLAAAKAAGLTRIPVVFARGGKPARRYSLAAHTTTDTHRLRVLKQRRDPAARHMRDEIRINRLSDKLGIL